ncbi:6-phosphofructo-2-kinase/fructose-2,6-bisphosphatase [Camellia lanceoleosa]|uniref:6-phosphofructo-2-kinase/fructose-2, 6-bisphosphatase n=1 Tax=Camellia lanceoleosa TaxID=1840588 RepID=A0ACC0IZX0_9ERIC|nr:6-phosphofructo-2-kinase/fructose-2,6-bisphosphatase [Camellia lanceoleosa]
MGAENDSSASLELDLEHYVVPAPTTSANPGLIYATNMSETPRSLTHAGVLFTSESSGSVSQSYKDGGVFSDRPGTIKNMLMLYRRWKS